MIKTKTVLVLFLGTIALGCGPGVGEGPVPQIDSHIAAAEDAGGLDANMDESKDASMDTGVNISVDATINPSNPVVPNSYGCELSILSVATILEASQIGDDVRFVAMGQNTIAANRTEAGTIEPMVFFLNDDERKTGWAQLSESPGSLIRAIGVVNRREAPYGDDWPFDTYAIVLASGESGNALYGANKGTNADAEQNRSSLQLIENSQLPADAELRGLVYLKDKINREDTSTTADSRFQKLCAFGDGIFCLATDGSSWDLTTVLSSGTGPSINSIGVLKTGQHWSIVAVGDQGRLVLISLNEDEMVQDMASGTDNDLQTVAIRDEKLATAGQQGVLLFFNNIAQPAQVQDISEQTIVSLKWMNDNELRGITQTGDFFQIPFSGQEACYFDFDLNSVLYGRLDGADADFLILSEGAFLRGHAEHDPVVLL